MEAELAVVWLVMDNAGFGTIAGLESMLLGAHAEGVRNVLAITGDPSQHGDRPGQVEHLIEIGEKGLAGEVVLLAVAAQQHRVRLVDADDPEGARPGARGRLVARPDDAGERGGAVVNIASIAGQIGLTGTVAYAASKGGLKMLTRALGVELAFTTAAVVLQIGIGGLLAILIIACASPLCSATTA